MADENKKFDLKIITPERMFYEGSAEMVEFNTTEGAIGVYKNHIPMTVIIKPGVLTITEGEEKKEAALVQNTYIEFASVQYHEATITKMAEQVWTKDMKKKLSDLKSMELYIKPEEKKVYYVFNKKETGDFDL